MSRRTTKQRRAAQRRTTYYRRLDWQRYLASIRFDATMTNLVHRKNLVLIKLHPVETLQ